MDTWQLFRDKQMDDLSITHWDDHLTALMNKVLPIYEIVENISIDVPADILEKKKKRLRWKWTTIRDYNANAAIPVMTGYKKTFARLSSPDQLHREAVRATGIKDLSSLDAKTLYYIAKPFVITKEMFQEYLISKFGLNKREQSHILHGITISSPSSDKSAQLFFNFDPIRMLRLIAWLDSDELRYRPGGVGYRQTERDFLFHKERLNP